jgi:hypothetical protein
LPEGTGSGVKEKAKSAAKAEGPRTTSAGALRSSQRAILVGDDHCLAERAVDIDWNTGDQTFCAAGILRLEFEEHPLIGRLAPDIHIL